VNLWKNRDSYTKSKKWPVIPYRLTQYENENKKYKTIYTIGLHKNLVMGWTTNLSENIITHHPVKVWEKKSIFLQKSLGGCKEYDTLETKLFYDLLSPLCHKFRKKNKEFENRCYEQDKNAVSFVFKLMDKLSSNNITVSDLLPYYDIKNINGHCDKNKIRIFIKKSEDNSKFYFEYRCPCMNLLEMIFPIIFEGVTIALVLIGQIVYDLEKFEKSIRNLGSITEKSKNTLIKKTLQENVNDITKNVFKQIEILEEEYKQQINGERRRIMNEILDKLMKIFLQTPSNDTKTLKKIIKEDISIITEAKNYLVAETGTEDIPIYLHPDELYSTVNKDSKFYKNLLIKAENKASWYNSLNDLEDLFDTQHMSCIGENFCLNNDTQNDNKTFFIMISNQDDEPIVISVKYKDKNRFLRNESEQSTQFEHYLLPKFALLIHNMLLRLEAQKSTIMLTENRERLSHEVGQIAMGVRALNKRYNNIFFEKKNNFIRQKNKKDIDSLEKSYEEFIKKSMLYKDDVESQFQIIEMLLKVHGDNIIPNPKKFDIWTEFLNRWNIIFSSQCSINNQFLVMPFSQHQYYDRSRTIITDPVLIQCALYNIVNNAIKYSYVNTKININFEKEFIVNGNNIKIEMYKFTVENYGAYLNPDDKKIYEKNIRSTHGKGTINFDSSIAGEGLGLYWTDMLVKKLNGAIYNLCDEKPICKYHIPLMKPFFTRCREYPLFREFWDKSKEAGLISREVPELSYQEIKNEYDRLMANKTNGISEYDKIVSDWSSDKLNGISFFRLCTDMGIPTHKISFIIKIPKLAEEVD
jgi:signal transduction histidine kinase